MRQMDAAPMADQDRMFITEPQPEETGKHQSHRRAGRGAGHATETHSSERLGQHSNWIRESRAGSSPEELHRKGQGTLRVMPVSLLRWRLEHMVHLPVEVNRTACLGSGRHRNVEIEPLWLMTHEQRGGEVSSTGICDLLKLSQLLGIVALVCDLTLWEGEVGRIRSSRPTSAT